MGSREQRSYGKVAKMSAVWALMRDLGGQLIAIPAAMVLARLLSPEDFGKAAAVNFFYLLANRLGTLGLNAALIRMKNLRSEHMSAVFVVSLGMGALTMLAMYFGSWPVATFYRTPETGAIMRVAALNFLLIPLGTVPMALVNRQMRFKAAATIDVLSEVALSGSAVAFALAGWGVWSLIYGQICANVVQSGVKLAVGGWRPSLRFSRAAFAEVVPFGAGVYAKRLIDYSARNLDSLVVGRVLGLTALGYYERAFNTMQRFQERLTIAPGVSFRIFAVIQGDAERYRMAYGKVMLSVSLLALPVFAALFVMAPHFLAVVFGEKWLPSTPALRVLCAVGVLKLLNIYGSSAIQASGRIWSEVWRQALYAALIVVGIVTFRAWGPVGAAVGVLAATAVVAVLMQGLVCSVVGVRWWELMRSWRHGAACATLLLVLLPLVHGLVERVHGHSEVVLLVVEAATAGLVFLAFVLLTPAREVRALVGETVGDLAPRARRLLGRGKSAGAVQAAPHAPVAESRQGS